MLESIIADDMLSHLEHNKLILDSQHGFRSGRSCLTNLVDFFHDMFSIYDKSRAVDILYLDFPKGIRQSVEQFKIELDKVIDTLI